MGSPGSRWQLLFMADDGRIIPFRRIKGLALVFLAMLVVLVVVCTGLGWWLTSEIARHEQTKAQLVGMENQMALYLKDQESRAFEPVAAKTPMEKTDLPEQQPAEPLLPEPTVSMDNFQSVSEPIRDEDKQMEKPVVPESLETTGSEPIQQEKMISVKTQIKSPAVTNKDILPVSPALPSVELGDKLKVTFNPKSELLKVRFRIRNAGPRSSPARGRCVVVLKPGESEESSWLIIPYVTLVKGEPTGHRGNRFKISRYMDMTVKAVGPMDPSRFSTATIYVYSRSGDKLVEKVFPLDIPSPE